MLLVISETQKGRYYLSFVETKVLTLQKNKVEHSCTRYEKNGMEGKGGSEIKVLKHAEKVGNISALLSLSRLTISYKNL